MDDIPARSADLAAPVSVGELAGSPLFVSPFTILALHKNERRLAG
jgi:hypothetical protein